MMMKIPCPACQVEGSISMVEADYNGPYKCWKCRALFSIEIHSNKLISAEPLSEEEFLKQQEAESLKRKFRK
ncbi:hypothetical protein ACFLTW_05630 [Chloroflexota bacterium]